MFEKLKLSTTTAVNIEWEMTPDLAFCTFSAKGLRNDLVNTNERVCYFFIDNWGSEPKLYLMERGVRHVNILAEITAPLEMLTDSILNHGCTLSVKDNYPVDDTLKAWLIKEVVEQEGSPFLIPTLEEKAEDENFGEALPLPGETGENAEHLVLPAEHCTLRDEQMSQLITKWNFYDSKLNPHGSFDNALVASDGSDTIIDEKTGIMWQRGGLDLCSIRKMTSDIKELNRESFAGYKDWRMPTVEEAMSLIEATANEKGLYIHPCFSKEQTFIFVAAKRKPTGYWFVDYKQGKVYWSSGTVPGGFCRLCRRVTN